MGFVLFLIVFISDQELWDLLNFIAAFVQLMELLNREISCQFICLDFDLVITGFYLDERRWDFAIRSSVSL